MLPSIEFCGLHVARLVIGANPFAGYSHQSKTRDEAMVSYYTVERILETWDRAEKAGINTMVTNNETPHVVKAVRQYIAGGGTLQWVAQVSNGSRPDMTESVEDVVGIGCKALYFHGALVDDLYAQQDEETLCRWVDQAKSYGVPVGVAGHDPRAHAWVDTLDVVDFHAIPFFNCGSLHQGAGTKFKLRDMGAATVCVRAIKKPCIGYKIMGAGRMDPQMAFEYALDNIKPTDVINVGMYRGDKDDMVEENAAMVEEILTRKIKDSPQHKDS